MRIKKDYNNPPEKLEAVNLNQPFSQKKCQNFFNNHQIYIRDELLKLYHKCAYCETGFAGSLHRDHYRPKDKYNWLVCEWSNLLLSCQRCNQQKGSAFPLVDENKRQTEYVDKKSMKADSTRLLAEKPLILNPEYKTFVPQQHMICLSDGTMKGISKYGEKTIEVFKLNERDLLIQKRKEIVDKYKIDFKNCFGDYHDHKNENSLKKQLERIVLHLLDNSENESTEYRYVYWISVKKFKLFFEDSIPHEWMKYIHEKILVNS